MPEWIAAFTAACAAKGVLVVATANDEGHVEIARAEPGPGAAAGVVPWAIVKAVAPGIFGPCASVAAAEGWRASARAMGEHPPEPRPAQAASARGGKKPSVQCDGIRHHNQPFKGTSEVLRVAAVLHTRPGE